MKINITNTAAVNDAIDTAAGKARQHIHTGPQIERDCSALHAKLCQHLPKRLLVGTVFRLSSRPCLPKAYGARKVIHTEVEVEVCPSGLFVVAIQRCEAWACSTKYPAATVILPEPVKNHLKDILYSKTVRI